MIEPVHYGSNTTAFWKCVFFGTPSSWIFDLKTPWGVSAGRVCRLPWCGIPTTSVAQLAHLCSFQPGRSWLCLRKSLLWTSYSIYKLTCIRLPVPHNCALVVHTAWHILYISCKLCVSVRRLLLLYSVSFVNLSNVGHPRWPTRPPPRPPTTFGKSAGILQCLRV